MDQTGPTSHAPQADRPGDSKAHTVGTSTGLDLLQVLKPLKADQQIAALDSTAPAHPAAVIHRSAKPATMGQFLNHVDKLADRALDQTTSGGTPYFSKRENISIPIEHHSLNHELIFRSVEAKNPSFTTSEAPDGTRTLNNIKGMVLTMKAFGHDEELAIKSISIQTNQDGKTTFNLKVQNPMTPEVAKVFNAGDTLPLTFSTDARGHVQFPQDSEIFNSLAQQSSGTLPGMVLSDAMKNAGSVAQFIEENPKWVNNIMAPFADRFGTFIKSGFNANTIIQQPADAQTPQKKPVNAPNNSVKDAAKITVRADATAVTPTKPVDSPAKPVGSQAKPLDTQAKAPARAVDAPLPKLTKPGDYAEKMQIEGRDRTFSIHVPPGYDPAKPMPMVLMVHGMSQKGADLQEMISSNKLADKEGFIAVYPDSINWFNIKDLRTWETGNGLVLPGQKAGDVQFMTKLIASTQQQLNVDPMRIHMAGFSNGGMLAFATAGALSGTLASVAILSSTMSGREPRPKEPISLINIHGDKDEIIPIEGLTGTPPVLRDVGVPLFQPTHFATDYYKALNGITEPYKVTKNGRYTIETASNPQNGTAVEQITVAGADHFLDNHQYLLQQTWDFLKAHPRTQAPNPKDNIDYDPSPRVEDMTALRQLKYDIKARGTSGLEQDVDNIFDAARTIKDFSFNPSNIFDTISKSTYVNFTDPVSTFIQNTTSMSKKGDLIEIKRKSNTNIPLDLNFGPGALKSLEVGNISFDLAKVNSYPAMRNVKGLTLHAQVAGHDMSSRIEGITELPDGPGGQYGRIYEATMQNPLPGWMRSVLLSPRQFNVDIKFDVNMQPIVVNQTMTQRQLLGRNPWVNGIADEAQDAINLKENVNMGNSLRLASDVGITSGLTYLGLRLGGSRAKTAAAVGFMLAPVAIDFIRKELGT